jgi:hypothetical protein
MLAIIAVRILGIWLIYRAIVLLIDGGFWNAILYILVAFFLNGILFPIHIRKI